MFKELTRKKKKKRKNINLPKARNPFGGVAGAGKQYHAAPAEGDGLQRSAAQGA